MNSLSPILLSGELISPSLLSLVTNPIGFLVTDTKDSRSSINI